MNPGAGHWSRFWAAKGDLDRVYPSSPAVLQALVAHLGPRPARVLEIGSGTGRDTAALAALGHSAVALDATFEALALSARAAPALVGRGIVGGDAFHLPFRDATFDAVFHQGVLEHFGNPAAFLAENFRVTAPGGVLVVDVPQRWHPWT
ncbi:MAG: class I SAM-dependent methyltransferase, partial [Gemmatimonadota bacterium]